MDTYTITFTNGSTTTFTVTNGSDASVTVDTALSSSSTNPVQNKVINTALNGKANSSHTHSISDVNNLQTTLESKASTSHTHTKSEVTDFAHNHGQITNGGALTSSAVSVESGDFILITDVSNSNYIRKVSNLLATHIKDSTAHSTIGSAANATQEEINAAIDGELSKLESLIGDAITYINQ